MGEMIRMVVVLSLICGLSGLSLASLKQFADPYIEEQQLVFVQGPAIEQVLPAHDNDPVQDRKVFSLADGGEVTVFPALSGGKLVGVALESASPGFGGDLGVMVGFSATGDTLTGIGITTMRETPGVGSRVTLPSFTDQFRNHALQGVALRPGGDVDAVSGATISSTAAVTAVQQASRIFEELKAEIEQTWPVS